MIKSESYIRVIPRSRRSSLRWLGHLCRMGDDRPAKQLPYSELVNGPRPVSSPQRRFNDTLKTTLKCGNVLNVCRSIPLMTEESGELLWNVSADHTAFKGFTAFQRQREARRRREVDSGREVKFTRRFAGLDVYIPRS